MNILVKFPTRSRPEKFAQTLNTYQRLRATNNVRFLVTIDEDDRTMNNRQMLHNLSMWGNLEVDWNLRSGKIHAINSGVSERVDNYDIILLASDDMIPQLYGWDQIIIDEMHSRYPDLDGVLWFNDGHVGQRLNTLVCCGRTYYKRFGYLYNPVYNAFWCDNEFMDVANILGKQTYIDRVIIEHQHPIWMGKGQDRLNMRDNQYYNSDEAIYHERKQRNFDLAATAAINTDTHVEESAVSVSKVKKRIRKADKPSA